MREDLSAVIQSISQSLAPGLEALYLFGSFALGEGFLFRSAADRMAGDPYRLLIVPNEAPFPESRVEGLQVRLSRELHQPDVQLHQIPFFRLHGLPAGVLHDDIQKSALLLWGNPGALLRVSHYRPEDMPLGEGERLLNDGVMDLLLSCPGRKGVTPEAPPSFHAARAVFSLAAALLIPLRKYHPSLRVRGRRISDEFASFPSLVDLFRRSIRVCANNGEPFGPGDWLCCRSVFLQGALRFVNWRYAYEVPFTDSDAFCAFHQKLFQKGKAMASFRIALSLLRAFPGETAEEKLALRGARKEMSEGEAGGSDESSWEETVEQFLNPGHTERRGKYGSAHPEARGREQGRDDDG